MPFPRFFALRQKLPTSPRVDVAETLRRDPAWKALLKDLRPAARVAVAVGSRGITNLARIARAVIDQLTGAGARPFILPAMGSHGGATPAGQRRILADYGVTESAMGVPVEASLDVASLGRTPEGVEVFCSRVALQAEGIVLINRVKPHTDFSGEIGSGLVKMLVIGLGKRTGAVAFHAAAMQRGYAPVLQAMAQVTLRAAPVLGGVAIVEDPHHQTARLQVLRPDTLVAQERVLLAEAARLMPRLPFDEIDVLIVDRLGKNLSGAGMDPNVIGRHVHGYSLLPTEPRSGPRIRRLFVRELTPETHGNAIGLGLADFTTTRLVRAMDRKVTYLNALTALSLQGAKVPIHFDTDREVLEKALGTLAPLDPREAKVIRITDTLSLERLAASEAYLDSARRRADLEILTPPVDLEFDAAGNLPALAQLHKDIPL